MNDVSAPLLNSPKLPQGKKSKLAIVSLILGVLSPFCLFVISGIPAVICGYLALSRIKKSKGTLNGKKMAVSGLVLGYVSFATTLLFMWLVAWMSSKAVENAKAGATLSNVRQIAVICADYAENHNGKYPESLEQLMREKFLFMSERSLLARGGSQLGYVYIKGFTTESAKVRRVLLYDEYLSRSQKLVVGFTDGSAEIMREKDFQELLKQESEK
jgi:hypothetical protein